MQKDVLKLHKNDTFINYSAYLFNNFEFLRGLTADRAKTIKHPVAPRHPSEISEGNYAKLLSKITVFLKFSSKILEEGTACGEVF